MLLQGSLQQLLSLDRSWWRRLLCWQLYPKISEEYQIERETYERFLGLSNSFSTTPFCWGVLGVENCRAMPLWEQKWWKYCEINIPTLSDLIFQTFLMSRSRQELPILEIWWKLEIFCKHINPNLMWEIMNDKQEVECTPKSNGFYWTTKIHMH